MISVLPVSSFSENVFDSLPTELVFAVLKKLPSSIFQKIYTVEKRLENLANQLQNQQLNFAYCLGYSLDPARNKTNYEQVQDFIKDLQKKISCIPSCQYPIEMPQIIEEYEPAQINRIQNWLCHRCELILWKVLIKTKSDKEDLFKNFLERNMLEVAIQARKFNPWFKKNQNTLTVLTSLNLSNMQLTSLPKELRCLTRLTELFLQRNLLSSIPEWINQLSEMRVLNLSWNLLTTLSKNVFGLINLNEIYITNNPLDQMDRLIQKLARLQLLENIFLSSAQLSLLGDNPYYWLCSRDKNAYITSN